MNVLATATFIAIRLASGVGEQQRYSQEELAFQRQSLAVVTKHRAFLAEAARKLELLKAAGAITVESLTIPAVREAAMADIDKARRVVAERNALVLAMQTEAAEFMKANVPRANLDDPVARLNAYYLDMLRGNAEVDAALFQALAIAEEALKWSKGQVRLAGRDGRLVYGSPLQQAEFGDCRERLRVAAERYQAAGARSLSAGEREEREFQEAKRLVERSN
ncbi:hypothetical protein [Rhizobacter fulvus]